MAYDKKGGQDCQKKAEDRMIFEVKKKEATTEADYCCTFCCCCFREDGERQRK